MPDFTIKVKNLPTNVEEYKTVEQLRILLHLHIREVIREAP